MDEQKSTNPEAAAPEYSFEKPREFTVEATDALFSRKGALIAVTDARDIQGRPLVFSNVTHVKVKREVVPVELKGDERKKTVKMTHSRALSFEQDGYIVTPSPMEQIRKRAAAEAKAKADAAAEATAPTPTSEGTVTRIEAPAGSTVILAQHGADEAAAPPDAESKMGEPSGAKKKFR